MCDVVEKAEGGRIRISAGAGRCKRGSTSLSTRRTVKKVLRTGATWKRIGRGRTWVRIKTVYGATGSVSNFTYADITLKNITKYGIVIEQDYENGSPMATGKPTSGVPISNVTLKDVKGTVTSSSQENVF
ncbi:glycosyl hydrolases family 28-domain-containing protein [Kalaharituber pfeilii]|nr:glycosyl hydrolases family 28-domain-containing protein [Kalaharituber pfeilii]